MTYTTIMDCHIKYCFPVEVNLANNLEVNSFLDFLYVSMVVMTTVSM